MTMVITIGDGSKFTNIIIEDAKYLKDNSDVIYSDESERLYTSDINSLEDITSFRNPECELEIDGIRVPASSISSHWISDKRKKLYYMKKTIYYQFVFITNNYPIKKTVTFYRSNETIPSFSSQIIITGDNTPGRDYEFFSSQYISRYKKRIEDKAGSRQPEKHRRRSIYSSERCSNQRSNGVTFMPAVMFSRILSYPYSDIFASM